MENSSQIVETIALGLGASWASGINLYAAILALGLMGATGTMDLPPGLEVLSNPLVIGAAGLMYFVEFFVDKTPGVDTGWDAIHTFVRIPAGAMLAAGAIGDVGPAAEFAAFLIGGGMAATSHVTKAGSRVIINTSPEPVTNWTASIAEDIAVFVGIWAAIQNPWLFLGLLVVFLILVAWLLPKIWRGIKALARRVRGFFGGPKDTPVAAENAGLKD